MNHRVRKHSGAHRGFTLIEAIIAVVILAVAIPPLIWAMTNAHNQRVGPVQASVARWLAAEKLEEVIADRHSPSRGYDYVATGAYPAESPIDGFPDFARSISVHETGSDLATPGEGYKRVTAMVTYTGNDGSTRTFSLSTILTEHDG